MSYARFLESDIYVYLSISGCYECCACSLHKDSALSKFSCLSTDEMIDHVREHIAAGDRVPERTIPHLQADREENDRFIAEYQQEREESRAEGAVPDEPVGSSADA